jgi:hypothetical protein
MSLKINSFLTPVNLLTSMILAGHTGSISSQEFPPPDDQSHDRLWAIFIFYKDTGNNMKQLRMVILDCAYDTISDERTQQLLARTAAVKISGYRASYPYGVLPVDTSDFVGRHATVCEETGDGFRVLCATKSISLKRCRQFSIPFPIMTLAKANLPEHVAYVERQIAEAEAANVDVVYQFSWSADPSIRSTDRALAVTLKEIILAQLMWEGMEVAPAKVLVGGNIRFKTDQSFEQMGYRRGSTGKRLLESFDVPYAFGEKGAMLDLDTYSLYARNLGKKHQDLWDNRLIVASPQEVMGTERKVA